jgi:hypothetical protein
MRWLLESARQKMKRSVKLLLGDELLELVERSLQRHEQDIEMATEAYDEAIRRDNKKIIEKIQAVFQRTNTRAILWLANAKRSLDVLELPPPGHYQGHLYVVLISDYTEQNQFYGAYVGSSKYTPATRFQQHKSGYNASRIVQKRGLQVLNSLCWPDGRTVPGGRKLIYWESALNRCLARVIPKVSGDWKPIEEWEETFQKPLRDLCGL